MWRTAQHDGVGSLASSHTALSHDAQAGKIAAMIELPPEPASEPGIGAGTMTKSFSPRPQVHWTTRLRIALDVAAERRLPWASPARWMTALGVMAIVTSLASISAGVALSFVVATVLSVGSLMVMVSGPIIDRIMCRLHKRAARSDEITALRFYSRPGTWPVVRNAADDWLRSCPRLPITIAMILRWEGEAAAKIRAAMPPSKAEQAFAETQAFAFE